MDPALREIDQIISNMTSEKVGLQRSDHSHGDEQTHHDDDGEFLDLILNEMTRGDVSNLDRIDDHTVSSIFPPLSVAGEQTTRVGLGNTTSQPLSAFINQPVLLNQTNVGTSTPSASGVTITYQLSDQVIMLSAPLSASQNGIPVVATTLPSQLMDIAPPSVANSENSDVQEVQVVSTGEPSGSRKRKLYEEDQFSDPLMEKKRQNAITAKRHRDMKKHTIQSLLDELKSVKEERDSLKKVNEGLKKEQMQVVQNQQEDREALVKEVEELRKEKEMMKQQVQTLEQQHQHVLQQGKIGLPDIFDFKFDF